MRRRVIQDLAQLLVLVVFVAVLLGSDASRWLVILGAALIALQAWVMTRRILKFRRPSS